MFCVAIVGKFFLMPKFGEVKFLQVYCAGNLFGGTSRFPFETGSEEGTQEETLCGKIGLLKHWFLVESS